MPRLDAAARLKIGMAEPLATTEGSTVSAGRLSGQGTEFAAGTLLDLTQPAAVMIKKVVPVADSGRPGRRDR